ncbi:hypothetical protein V7968_06675 [Nocardia vulneris]|uniref:hypothetical protein n=1 Tax=Nocardia vulneris TaxID=1141657 RepID=UPI0030CC6C1B
MTRIRFLLLPALLAAVVSGCGNSERGSAALTAAERLVDQASTNGVVDKGAVQDALRGVGLPQGVTSDDLLDQLMSHRWKTKDSTVGNLFAWIGSDAGSSDAATSTRAGESATMLARYVADHSSKLLNVDGPRTSAVGEVNPELVQSLAVAFTPYLRDLAGASPEFVTSRGFTAPDPLGNLQRPKAQNIFAVIDSGATSALDLNRQAVETIAKLQSDWTRSWLADPQNPELQLAYYAGTLKGLVTRGLDTEAADRADDQSKDPKEVAPRVSVSNDLDPAHTVYEIARTLQDADDPLAHDPRYDNLFQPDGRLEDYRTLVDSKSTSTLYSDLLNIVNTYRGGAMKNAVQDLEAYMRQAAEAVLR